MVRFCANCGTEVDDAAVFCPTCGQPIEQADESAIPPAPAWPEPPRSEPAEAEPDAGAGPTAAPSAVDREEWIEEPTRVEPRPASADDARRTGAPPPAATPVSPAAPSGTETEPPAAGRGVDLPITWPVTLSAWLIGIGAVVAAIGLIIGMFRVVNVIDLLVLLVLVAIAVSVFLATVVPAYRNLRLATLAAVLIAFGIGVDRIGFGLAGVGELLLFLGTAAAAIGALMLELGYDQPLGGGRG